MRYRFLSFCMAVLFIIPLLSSQTVLADEKAKRATDSADSRTIKLLEALDLMTIDDDTGFFWDEMLVKRSELAKIVCKLYGISATKDETPRFTDVNDSERAYVETVVRNGYMSGYSENKFGAEDYVTNNQLIKTVVIIMEGGIFAESLGGYPNGYITVGKKLGIVGGKVSVGESAARRIDTANIIYKAMHSDILTVMGISDGELNYERIEGHTFLTEKRNIYRAKGIIKKNESTGLNRADGVEKGMIQIGETIYYDRKQLADDYLGCNVECYAELKDGDTYGEIIYVEESGNNKTVTLRDDDIVGVDGNTISYYDDDKIKSLNMAVIFDRIYNGVALDYRSEFTLDSLKSLDNADIKFIDNNGDGAYEVVIVTEYSVRVVNSVNMDEKKITFRFDEKPIELENSFYRIFRDGKKSELGDINSGDVVLSAISKDVNKEKTIRIEASSKSVKGTVSEIKNEDGKKRNIKIDGDEYTLSRYCDALADKNKISTIKPGMSATFYMDNRGNIAYLDENAPSVLAAYLIDYRLEISGMSYVLSVKLFNENGQMKTFSTGESITINGTKMKLEDIYSNSELREQLNTPQLIQYSESEGVIKEIIFAQKGYDKQKFSLDVDNISLKSYHQNTLADKYYLSSETKVFYIPNLKKSDVGYSNVMSDKGLMFVLPRGFIGKGDTYNVSLYDVEENGTIKYILETYAVGSPVGAGGDILAVNDVIDALDDEKNPVKAIRGLHQSGSEVTIYLNEPDVLNAKVAEVQSNGTKNFDSSKNRDVRRGDLIQYHINSVGKVDDIWIQHSPEDTEYYVPCNMNRSINEDEYRCVFGKVMFASLSSVIVSGNPTGYLDPTSDGNKYLGDTGSLVCTYSSKNNRFYQAKFDDVEVGDNVFAFVDSANTTRILVIYE